MPSTTRLHHTPHLDPARVCQIILMAANAIMFGLITLIMASALIG